MRILAVDDDAAVIDLLSTILGSEGFCDVEYFTSSLAALDRLRTATRDFDCLMLDISMPDMNGIELCRRARLIAKYEEVPIIMLTALREENTVQESMLAGATDYITKPFDVLQLGVRIRMSANLVRANRALGTFRHNLQVESGASHMPKAKVTENEIKTIFAEDLYNTKKG